VPEPRSVNILRLSICTLFRNDFTRGRPIQKMTIEDISTSAIDLYGIYMWPDDMK
jgi:hypothetical protein